VFSCFGPNQLFVCLFVCCDSSADGEDEEEVVHMGNAIMSFYSALIDLLGRCAPEMHVSNRHNNNKTFPPYSLADGRPMAPPPARHYGSRLANAWHCTTPALVLKTRKLK